ncbi:dTDP-4-dehydrorhamnose reductase [Tardiphaga sp. vice154]|uniref:dTDP-4-dehydrorhamnose reductase n=1 Tax=Tardiphaga sp. vice154 TaxID=2592814 RepID=UPI0011637527|nr:dTDP-4-dehydrorhamnose reductase [Tardiphaga sp. vice154]QDM22617.1 dTDP-4-dehydrorhamnose reductase [Tardiphaga sp. vice154]
MRIAVTGRNGQVVQSLLERAAAAGIQLDLVARPEVDLAQPAAVEAALLALRPDAIVSAAAYTAVDLAETEPELAHAVNGAGASAVARAAAQLGIPVVHLSTDYVFDGTLQRPYRETDPTGPVGVYGQSKLDGERAVAAATGNHAILRTAWVYSPFGKNFVRTMLTLAGKRDEISVVSDQRGTPTNALDIADAVIAVTKNLLARREAPELRGTFHMTGGGDTTWAEFAEAIFAASRERGGPAAGVIPIPSSAYPTPAKRPANSRLDNALMAQAHDVRLPHWRDSLPATVARLLPEFQGK